MENLQLNIEVSKCKEVIIDNTFTRYFVNKEGKVFSMSRVSKRLKELKTIRRADGYYYVNIKNYITKKNRTIMVHRMVAAAYLTLDKKYYGFNKYFINHIDSNPSNNNLDNLEIVTPSENSNHHFQNNYSYTTKHSSHKGYTAFFKGIYLGFFKSQEEASDAVYNYLITNCIPLPKYSKFYSIINQ